MLDISLVPLASSSTGFGRFYPHEGYLGLSPVTVGGSIVARLPPLYPSLPIRQVIVSIRCVATRTIGSDLETVLYEKAKRLWEPAGEAEYEELGDWSSPFKVIIPVEAALEAASAQWTRDLKVVWQLQIAFEHKPIPYVGHRIVKTYLLDLHSYVNLPVHPPSPPSAALLPGAQVFVNNPHGTFGPGEPFTVSLHVKPDDPATSIRRTTLILERRTQLVDPCPADTPQRKERKISPSFPSWRRSNSPQPYAKLEEAMVHTTKVLEVHSDEAVPGSGGTYWVSLTALLPKRGGNWEAGETGSTKLTKTTFDCKVRISLKGKGKAKEIVCPPIPIVLVGSTAAERIAAQAILTAEAEAHPKASLPKRKHRSSRRGLYMHEGTTDISDPVVHGATTRSRRRHDRSVTASAILAATPVPVITSSPPLGVKPILLPSNPTPQPQSISFAFPQQPSRPALPITTLIHPPSPSSASATPVLPTGPSFSNMDPFHDPFNGAPRPGEPYPDMSIIRQFQSSGRRISTSTSEEEEMQPSRSRIRLDESLLNPFFPPTPGAEPGRAYGHDERYHDHSRDNGRVDRPSLPSLDVLGLRLPPVPEYDQGPRRPRTAPVHSAFPVYRGTSSGGMDGKGAVPPPLSGAATDGREVSGEGARPVTSDYRQRSGKERREEEGAFAFGMNKR